MNTNFPYMNILIKCTSITCYNGWIWIKFNPVKDYTFAASVTYLINPTHALHLGYKDDRQQSSRLYGPSRNIIIFSLQMTVRLTLQSVLRRSSEKLAASESWTEDRYIATRWRSVFIRWQWLQSKWKHVLYSASTRIFTCNKRNNNYGYNHPPMREEE